MEKLSPEIALEKHYKMWNAMAKIEEENEITGYHRFEFRMDFKEDWCRKNDENPVNNCYLCEYAFRTYLKEYGKSNQLKQLNELKSDTHVSILMEKSICRHCPILWNNNRENNDCEQNDVNWTLSPIKDILALPVNTEEIKEYHTNNT